MNPYQKIHNLDHGSISVDYLHQKIHNLDHGSISVDNLHQKIHNRDHGSISVDYRHQKIHNLGHGSISVDYLHQKIHNLSCVQAVSQPINATSLNNQPGQTTFWMYAAEHKVATTITTTTTINVL